MAVLLVLVSTIAGTAAPVTEFPIPNVNKFSLRHHGWFDGCLCLTEDNDLISVQSFDHNKAKNY
jgi:hypothetical protein